MGYGSRERRGGGDSGERGTREKVRKRKERDGEEGDMQRELGRKRKEKYGEEEDTGKRGTKGKGEEEGREG